MNRASRGAAGALAISCAALTFLTGSVSAGSAAEAPKPVTHKVTIDATDYKPQMLAVKAGDSVVWVNNDLFKHSVTATGGSFDSRDIPPGGSWTYTAKAAGSFEYSCIYHPTMRGTLRVQ